MLVFANTPIKWENINPPSKQHEQRQTCYFRTSNTTLCIFQVTKLLHFLPLISLRKSEQQNFFN